jgi:hypothetical protein
MHSLDSTLGAAFLGTLAAAVYVQKHHSMGAFLLTRMLASYLTSLYGVTSVQTFMYFRDCKEDGRLLRCLVSGLHPRFDT